MESYSQQWRHDSGSNIQTFVATQDNTSTPDTDYPELPVDLECT